MAPNLLICSLEMCFQKKKIKICLLGLKETRESFCVADMEFLVAWLFLGIQKVSIAFCQT